MLRKVQSGDPLRIPAGTFNAIIDAVRDHQQRQQGREQTSFPAVRQSGIIRVRNDSGTDRERFDVPAAPAGAFRSPSPSAGWARIRRFGPCVSAARADTLPYSALQIPMGDHDGRL